MLLCDFCFPILQATPEQISMDLKNELMYQLEQDRDLQAVSLKYLNMVLKSFKTVNNIFLPFLGRQIKDTNLTDNPSYLWG